MPLARVRTVLQAPDVRSRDRAILAHLEHMEGKLAETQANALSTAAKRSVSLNV